MHNIVLGESVLSRLGVIFDLDNTLVQSKIDFRGMAQALEDRLRERLGPAVVPEGLAQNPISQIIESAKSLSTDKALIDELWQIVSLHEAMGMEGLELEPGALSVVETLTRTGHTLAICTNNARPATLKAILPFGDPPPFTPVVTRDEVHALKPSPEGVQMILKAWQGMDVHEVIMVGDSWLDGKAAADAGVPFVEYQGRPSRFRREPVPVWHRIERLSDLLAIIDQRELGAWTPKESF